jgi:hypothetical protein
MGQLPFPTAKKLYVYTLISRPSLGAMLRTAQVKILAAKLTTAAA